MSERTGYAIVKVILDSDNVVVETGFHWVISVEGEGCYEGLREEWESHCQNDGNTVKVPKKNIERQRRFLKESSNA